MRKCYYMTISFQKQSAGKNIFDNRIKDIRRNNK